MARPPRPRQNQDSAFFWDGVAKGELRIQRCAGCQLLRHPPRPMCPRCQSLDWDHVVSSGRGTVYSFVLHHHPPVHGFEVPFTVALVELEEGTRIVGNLLGIATDAVQVGLPVEVAWSSVEGEWQVPAWRPRETGR